MYKKPFSDLVIGGNRIICIIDFYFVVRKNIENGQLFNFISVILDNLLTE